ncbi:glycosyltransferase [Microbacterium sp. YY-03]|uniref:glycosyltransferase n=1 Tax=Microbacterium sp. YY-03 TaxID=3421636 RepID=UPI003D180989
MPAPIHAVLVVRADTRTETLAHLKETLAAIAEQTQPVDALTVVQCGSHTDITAVLNASGAESIIAAPATTGFAAAIGLASRRIAEGRALWLLAQDTVPAPDALQHLAARLETSLSVAVVAPKLVRANEPAIIESVGVSMTEYGRAVVIGVGQIDQGQHDGTEDLLGADIRGMLIRADEVKDLLPDPALAGGDEGLDIGVRARLRKHRVDLAPPAVVAVYGDGVAGLPAPRKARDRRRIHYVTRVAQLHRRLTYAPAWAVVLHMLSFPFLALGRTFQHLLNKQPDRVIPEWGGTLAAGLRWGAIARSRRALAGTRAGFKRVAPLRLTPRQVKAAERQEATEDNTTVKGDLRFFSGGGAWVALGALVVSIVLFPALLAWPTIAGGALLPLRDTVTQLWADTQFGYAGVGLDGPGPADPFATVVALIGSLWPAAPGVTFVALWVLALPLAVIGGWFAATRVTERSGLRIVGALAWALSPVFLSALMTPRPTAVLVHLLLPWLAYALMAAHRSWGAAGAASLILAAIAACSPSLGLFLVVAAVVAAVVFTSFGWVRSAVRFLWVIVPTLVWFVPLAWRNWTLGNPLATIVDPGPVFGGDRADSSWLGSLLLAAGFPDADPAGWARFLQTWGLESWAPFAALLVVPVLVLAVVAPFLARWRVGSALVLVAAGATAAALIVSRIALSFHDAEAVAIWPGALLSAAWLSLVLAALVTLDSARMKRGVTSTIATITTILIAVAAVPLLTAPARGEAALTPGRDTTLPAFVAAEARENPDLGTLVLVPQGDGSFLTRVVWGGTNALGAQSTLVNTRTTVTEADEALATEVAALVTPGAGTSADAVGELGMQYVLVALTTDEPRAQAARESAIASLNVLSGLTRVGETGKGALWRYDGEPAPRAEFTAADTQYVRTMAIAAGIVTLIALLLAIPTPTSVRASRRKPRIVDARGEEHL